jgi:hypothetical protein
MILVPKQLQRAGMTGRVPYYGGRFTPSQAYAASHARRPPAADLSPAQADQLDALQHLLDTGVLSADEFQSYRARVVG